VGARDVYDAIGIGGRGDVNGASEAPSAQVVAVQTGWRGQSMDEARALVGCVASFVPAGAIASSRRTHKSRRDQPYADVMPHIFTIELHDACAHRGSSDACDKLRLLWPTYLVTRVRGRSSHDLTVRDLLAWEEMPRKCFTSKRKDASCAQNAFG